MANCSSVISPGSSSKELQVLLKIQKKNSELSFTLAYALGDSTSRSFHLKTFLRTNILLSYFLDSFVSKFQKFLLVASGFKTMVNVSKTIYNVNSKYKIFLKILITGVSISISYSQIAAIFII